MPVSEDSIDFRQKYRNLKKKFKSLIFESECFQEELRKAQRKLLKVSRDKSFLLDRLLQYESVDSSSSDSDATESSDSDSEQKHELPPIKKKKPNIITPAETIAETVSNISAALLIQKPIENAVKKKKPPRKTPSKTTTSTVAPSPSITALPITTQPIISPQCSSSQVTICQPSIITQSVAIQSATTVQIPVPQLAPIQPSPVVVTPTLQTLPMLPSLALGDGHMTSEEIERHLEAKQALRDLLPEKAPLTVPVEMFSTEPSTLDSEMNDSSHGDSPPNILVTEDDGLIIDLPD